MIIALNLVNLMHSIIEVARSGNAEQLHCAQLTHHTSPFSLTPLAISLIMNLSVNPVILDSIHNVRVSDMKFD